LNNYLLQGDPVRRKAVFPDNDFIVATRSQCQPNRTNRFFYGSSTRTGTLSKTPACTYSATTSPGGQNAGNGYAGITALIGKSLSLSLLYGSMVISSDNSVQTLLHSINLNF